LIRYEEWEDDEGSAFLPDVPNKEYQLSIILAWVPRLAWWVEADSWEAACVARHEYHGWEPYVPLDLPSGASDT